LKHLKLFEKSGNWTHQKLYDRQTEEETIENAIWNYCVYKDLMDEDCDVKKYTFLKDGEIFIKMTDMDNMVEYIKVDGDEFARYLNNPGMFEETDKYNL